MKQAKKETNPIKSLAQFMFIVYIFVMFMFSFQADLVEYTEYVFLAFAVFAVIYALEKRTLIFAKEHYFLLGFCFVSFLTSLWAIDFNTAFNSSVSLTILVIMSILIYQVFDEDEVSKLIKAVFYAGVTLVVFTLINAGFTEYIDAILTGKRLGGAMNAPNTFGVYCSISFVFGIYLFKEKKLLYSILLFVLFTGILASGSRNAFIIATIGSVLAILFAFKTLPNTKKFLLILLFAALILVIYSLGLLDNIFSRIENLETPSGEEISDDHSLNSRLFMITFGFENFIYKPIFGYGINNAQFLLEDVFARTYLHNNYIELLVDVGIVGFCLYYIPQINLIKSLFKKRGDTLDICEILFVVLIVLMVADLSIVFYYNKLTYIILTMCMIANKSNATKKAGETFNE